MPAAAAFVGVTGNNNRAYTLGDRCAEVRPLNTPYKARGPSSAIMILSHCESSPGSRDECRKEKKGKGSV